MSDLLGAISTPGSSASSIQETAPATEVAKESSNEPLFSQKFSSLAKKEQRLRAEREALTKDREELQSLQAEIKKFRDAKERAKLNPQGLLDLGGLTFEEVQEFYLNNSTPTTTAVESELRRELNELKASLEQKEIQQHQSSVETQERQYKESLASFIAGSDAEFLKSEPNAAEIVYQKMFEHFQKHQAVLEPSEAVEMLEKEKEKEFEERYLKIGKVKNKFLQAPNESERRPQTLSQSLSNSMPTGSLASDPARGLTEKERMQAAAAQLRWIK